MSRFVRYYNPTNGFESILDVDAQTKDVDRTP